MNRQSALLAWLERQLQAKEITLLPMTGDASFRYYHRIKDFTGLIAVDAAPDLANDNHGFVMVAQILKNIDLHVPKVYAHDLENGFLLISDLGQTVYLEALQNGDPHALYGSALDSLARMQSIQALETFKPFDAKMMRAELENIRTWLVEKYLDCQLDSTWNKKLTDIFELLILSASNQPQVFIHRDYHSRNLLVSDQQTPGIIDFQDAMLGPVTYDAVSLLRDAYIAWPTDQVSLWASSFYQRIYDRHAMSPDHFIQAFDFMGIQRHLKAAFIFARKYLRDNNDAYLADIPRTLNYVLTVSDQYSETKDLHELLMTRLLPALAAKGLT
jgi:aminoglycoside/choline kinase family phosphotransferase